MKGQNDVRITFRVDKDLKEQAENLFDRLGLNMSAALNVFLRKSIDESGIPFQVNVKNTVMGAGYSPADITNAFESAVKNDIVENQQKGFPIARYDTVKKQAYLEFNEGTREYVSH